MEEIITNYKREDIYNQEKITELMMHYREILRLLGEDPDREGLIKTPERVAKAMSFITKGYAQDPIAILQSAMFKEEYQQMVLVKDIELFSVCVSTTCSHSSARHTLPTSPMATSRVSRRLPAWWSASHAAFRFRSASQCRFAIASSRLSTPLALL